MSRKYIQFRLDNEIEVKASEMVEKTSGSKGLCACFIAHAVAEFANKYELWDLQSAELKEFMKSYVAHMNSNTEKDGSRYQLNKSLALLRGVTMPPEQVVPKSEPVEYIPAEEKKLIKETQEAELPKELFANTIPFTEKEVFVEKETISDSLVDQSSRNKMNQVLARFQSS